MSARSRTSNEQPYGDMTTTGYNANPFNNGGKRSLRESLRNSQELSQKIKVHTKPNQRGVSIYLVEEFFNSSSIPQH